MERESVDASDLHVRVEDLESKYEKLQNALMGVEIEIEKMNLNLRELATKVNRAISVSMVNINQLQQCVRHYFSSNEQALVSVLPNNIIIQLPWSVPREGKWIQRLQFTPAKSSEPAYCVFYDSNGIAGTQNCYSVDEFLAILETYYPVDPLPMGISGASEARLTVLEEKVARIKSHLQIQMGSFAKLTDVVATHIDTTSVLK